MVTSEVFEILLQDRSKEFLTAVEKLVKQIKKLKLFKLVLSKIKYI